MRGFRSLKQGSIQKSQNLKLLSLSIFQNLNNQILNKCISEEKEGGIDW